MSYPNLSWILALPVFVSFRWRSLLQVMQQQPNNNTKGASPPNPMWETILETLISVENPWKTLSCFDFFLWWRVFSTVCAVEATILPALRFHTRYSSPVRARLACEKGRDPAKTCKNEESLGFLLRLLSGRRSMSGVYEFKPLQKKKHGCQRWNWIWFIEECFCLRVGELKAARKCVVSQDSQAFMDMDYH